MMAYLTRRQRFSTGGDATILPKPNPLSPQERNQAVFNDYVGRMKKYLGAGVGMPEWFVKDLIFKKADELGIKPLAKIISYADAAQEPEEPWPIACKEAVHIPPLEVVTLDRAVFKDAHVVHDGRALAHSVIHRYGDRPVRREKGEVLWPEFDKVRE